MDDDTKIDFIIGIPHTPDRKPITRYDYYLKYKPNLIINWPKNPKFVQSIKNSDVIFLKLKPEILESCDIIYTIVKKYGIKSAISNEFYYSSSATFLAERPFERNNPYHRELISSMWTIEKELIDASPPQISLEMIKTFSYIKQIKKDFNFVEYINHYEKEENEDYEKEWKEFKDAGNAGVVLEIPIFGDLYKKDLECYRKNIIKNVDDVKKMPLLFHIKEDDGLFSTRQNPTAEDFPNLNSVFITVADAYEIKNNKAVGYKVVQESKYHFKITPPKATLIFNNYIYPKT